MSRTTRKDQRLTHVKKERLGADQVGFLDGVGADDIAVREPELDRRVAVAERLLVLTHGALTASGSWRGVYGGAAQDRRVAGDVKKGSE